MPVTYGAITDEVLKFCVLQISWHHLGPAERAQGGRVPYLPAELYTRDRSLQVVGVTQVVGLNVKRVVRIGSR